MEVSSILPGRRVAWCPFESLCEEALGAVDFLALARTFRVVFISHVPMLSVLNKNQVHTRIADSFTVFQLYFYFDMVLCSETMHYLQLRRFITLIDALYESRSLVLVLAPASAPELLPRTPDMTSSILEEEVFAFDRCVSRLLEMQSKEYWVAAEGAKQIKLGCISMVLRDDGQGKNAVLEIIEQQITLIKSL